MFSTLNVLLPHRLLIIAIVVVFLFLFLLIASSITMCTAGVTAISAEKEFTYNGELGEDYANATETQRLIVETAMREPTTLPGYCAQWVLNVIVNAGFPINGGNANMLWAEYCDSNDISKLEVGMLIAVQHSGYSGDSWEYGHIGIYIGDNKVIHSIGYVEVVSLEEWLNTYDPFGTVRWGFPDSVKTIVELEKALEKNRPKVPDPLIPEEPTQGHISYHKNQMLPINQVIKTGGARLWQM